MNICRKGSNNKIIIGILIMLISIIVVFSINKSINKLEEKDEEGFKIDDNVIEGNLKSKTKEEIQAELNEKVAESMLNVSMNMNPVFKDGRAKGNLMIINEEINNYIQIVEIYRNDTQDRIYKSGGIPVGSRLELSKLDIELPKGVYPCTAYFIAIDEETKEPVGKVGVKIEIVIQN